MARKLWVGLIGILAVGGGTLLATRTVRQAPQRMVEAVNALGYRASLTGGSGR